MYKECVRNINEFLIQNEYILVQSNEHNNHIYNYKKVDFGRILRIGFIIVKEENKIVFWGFTVNINYFHLEELTIPILVKNNLFGNAKASDVYSSFFNQNDFHVPIINNKTIISSYDIDEVNAIFYKFYSESVLPYFNKWNSLNVLYEYIKDKEGREELHPILGQFWQFKKATILRLCNDENYQDYMDSFVERRKMILEKRSDSIDVQRYYNAAKQLKEVLDNTAPIYNV